MSEQNAVAVRENEEVRLSAKDIDILVTVGALPKDCPPDVVSFFARACAESRLSPFKRQIHIIKRWSKNGDRYTIQTGIDGYRAIANRTGQYAGNDDYRFDDSKSEYEMIQAHRRGPTTATSTVYRVVGGIRCPFSATARWEEYCPEEKQAFMWNKMPFLMLGKCAEALALRKAFPEELGGIYTDEEMAQADKTNTLPKNTSTPQGDVTSFGEAKPQSPSSLPKDPPKGSTKQRDASGEVGAKAEDMLLVDYTVEDRKSKQGKAYTVWTARFKTDSDADFTAGTIKSNIGESLGMFKGELCTIKYKAGKFQGTYELLAITNAKDDLPM